MSPLLYWLESLLWLMSVLRSSLFVMIWSFMMSVGGEERVVKSMEGRETPRVQAMALDWGKMEIMNEGSVDLLVGADLVYSGEIVGLLKGVVKYERERERERAKRTSFERNEAREQI